MVVAPLALEPDHLFGPEVDDVSPPRTLRLVGPRVVERPPRVNRATTSPQGLGHTLRLKKSSSPLGQLTVVFCWPLTIKNYCIKVWVYYEHKVCVSCFNP